MIQPRPELVVVLLASIFALHSPAAPPPNIVADGVPEPSAELRAELAPYLEQRSASFQGWHPTRREVYLLTRFGDVSQLHTVKMPGGARTQLTFGREPVGDAAIQPVGGGAIILSQDAGGSEFFQLHRLVAGDARQVLLTDGKSRNSAALWSRNGRWIAFTSTQRTGACSDVYVMNPAEDKSARLAVKIDAPGWSLLDWSWDGTQILLLEYVSINESYLHLADVKTGALRALTPKGKEPVSYGNAIFASWTTLFVTTDYGSQFLHLAKLDIETGQRFPIGIGSRGDSNILPWNFESLELSPDGKTLAFLANEFGFSRMYLMDTETQKITIVSSLPKGVISGLKFHSNNRDLGFTLASARSPADVYSVDVTTLKIERWTESEAGGLDPASFAEPKLVQLKSFDGLPISALVYRPDPKKFPGPRPVMIRIHGGPESQSRPISLGRRNYYINELGIALVLPNVRGSAGFGKSFLLADNGFHREDSVRDIGAVIDWIRSSPGLDGERIGVEGESYGGYMTLASLVHFSDRLRCGVDGVGISNFISFLENTQAYRRDLRRAEYGDERDPAMKAHLEKVSPLNHVQQITRPLLVVQGANDPRVPMGESRQMVEAMRAAGRTAWYLMAKDEGHGFRKKTNVDYEFACAVLFLKEHLLGAK